MKVRSLANIFRLAALLALTCSSLLAQDSDRAGIIRGIVLDATGQPVEGARVKASFTGGFSGIVPSAQTDKSGHFVIRRLVWGGWYVTASKEQAGYPDESNAFYGGFTPAAVTVDLSIDMPEQSVTVLLGRKAGSIFGTIADAETGKLIEPCARLQRKNVPSTYWSGYGLLKSKFHLLVPADTDITLMVWAQGYKPWVYESDDGNDALRVRASDQLKLQVRLTPNNEKGRPPTDEELKKMRESMSAGGCDDLPSVR
jgi:Carboxypeptidase regulatory-like domain